MYLSYRTRDLYRDSSIRAHRKGSMTMRAYFDAFAVHGRALLRGTPTDPQVWIAQVGSQLFVCAATAMSARRVCDTERVPGSAIYDRRLNGRVH